MPERTWHSNLHSRVQRSHFYLSPFSNPSCLKQEHCVSETHQIDRRMGLGEMRREGRCQDSTGSLIRPVVQRSCHGAQRTQSMVRWTGAVICAVGQGVFTQNHSFSGISICFTPGLLVRIEVQADTFLSHGAPFRSRKSVSFYQRKDFSALTLLAKV